MSNRVEIIAHRGTPREQPENSILGFRRALELGADAIELDVHLTADGTVVVHHDPVLHVEGSGSGNGLAIRDLTAAELRRYPLAPGVPVPTLAETLTVVGDRAIVYVEVKAAEAVNAVLRCLAAAPVTQCAIHGFDHRVSLRAAEASAAIGRAVPTGILSASYLIDPASALRAAQARDYWQQWEMIDETLVRQIHDAGGRVIAWTVNAPPDARRLRLLGVDGICTDLPGSETGSRSATGDQ